MEWYQTVGYGGSVLIALSLMMKNIFKLRKVNLIGATTFAVYGFLVNAYPVLFLNSFIALVDIYYLAQMYKIKDAFSLIPVLNPNHSYLNKFLDYYSNDIQKFSPEFDRSKTTDGNCYFILRNLFPVGIFIYKVNKEAEAEILLDYAIPDYRDLKNAEYLYYAASEFLKEKGIKSLITKSSVDKHIKYLKKVGFVEDTENNGIFKKKL
ncbi:MAG: hypothetical protein COW08_04010 [Ignavibacteriales bacterium CG12_big_fil_rev_8_21_14_0_65_30_8]|nr:MAG: hypothetical protein COW08_04010 [Ignavibacteriales bacterium CG12_big_fil_rev_8_21_14_0_65_30_8]